MTQLRFKIAKENKGMFNSKFAKKFATEIANFSSYGEQPLMTSFDNGDDIEINAAFVDKLPETSKTELRHLIQSLQ